VTSVKDDFKERIIYRRRRRDVTEQNMQTAATETC